MSAKVCILGVFKKLKKLGTIIFLEERNSEYASALPVNQEKI
jgi:hypothetical protein